jgi:alcohol dehydrogenase (cytochrome c)
VVANFSRNGFFYTLDRISGQFLRADQYQEKVTWTKGIDPKTGKPVDYDPQRAVQLYAGIGAMRGKPAQQDCPWWGGAPTFFPPTLDQKLRWWPAAPTGCGAPASTSPPPSWRCSAIDTGEPGSHRAPSLACGGAFETGRLVVVSAPAGNWL